MARALDLGRVIHERVEAAARGEQPRAHQACSTRALGRPMRWRISSSSGSMPPCSCTSAAPRRRARRASARNRSRRSQAARRGAGSGLSSAGAAPARASAREGPSEGGGARSLTRHHLAQADEGRHGAERARRGPPSRARRPRQERGRDAEQVHELLIEATADDEEESAQEQRRERAEPRLAPRLRHEGPAHEPVGRADQLAGPRPRCGGAAAAGASSSPPRSRPREHDQREARGSRSRRRRAATRAAPSTS
jgi:hypothetical protein